MLSYADACRLIERQPTAVISVTKRQVASTRPSLKLRTASDSRPFFVIFFLQLIFSSCWLTLTAFSGPWRWSEALLPSAGAYKLLACKAAAAVGCNFVGLEVEEDFHRSGEQIESSELQ
ncbi:hypothetical protein Q8A67_015022 [Cirrhinus molitorella]|uniref:Uncharacterized protein n=1 Tax=Cirrhinus molitorella TaxID=172907 RepID=A0AA88TN56_9TELE|nr:hypothetical protein Q8A67_015022 [Cirrhinus molitorella]